MSRGPGRVERRIADLFVSDPDGAHTVDELVQLIYGIEPVRPGDMLPDLRPRARPVTGDEIHAITSAALNEALDLFIGANSGELARSHAARVAVARAGKTLCHRPGSLINGMRDPGFSDNGGCGRGARLVFYRCDRVLSYGLARLKSETRLHGYRNETEMRARLAPGGDHHDQVIAGGSWHRHVAIFLADRDGDLELAARLRAKEQAAREAIRAALLAAAARAGF